MQQGFIDEDIKLPLPLHFPSKTIFLEERERDRKNKIFRMDAFFFVLFSARMDCRTFEGESNCFRVQTGVTRDLLLLLLF